MSSIMIGASGLLGTQVYHAFKMRHGSDNVLGLAFSRSVDGTNMKKLDLTDAVATEKMFSDFGPDCESRSSLDHC